MLKKAFFLSCLAFLRSGYKAFLISSTSLGKSSATPYVLPFGKFLMYDFMSFLSLKKDTFAIMCLAYFFFCQCSFQRWDVSGFYVFYVHGFFPSFFLLHQRNRTEGLPQIPRGFVCSNVIIELKLIFVGPAWWLWRHIGLSLSKSAPITNFIFFFHTCEKNEKKRIVEFSLNYRIGDSNFRSEESQLHFHLFLSTGITIGVHVT